MFDILLYLYDTYLLSEHFPDSERLSRKLSAAGFEDEAIGEALDWLAALDDLSTDAGEDEHPAVRIYSTYEISRLATEGRGFLTFLEGSGLLPVHAREWVIDRALALSDTEVSTNRVKWIALLALWKLKGAGDVLWLEDLVRGGEVSDEDGDDVDDSDDALVIGWQPTLH
jgi:Smg protein